MLENGVLSGNKAKEVADSGKRQVDQTEEADDRLLDLEELDSGDLREKRDYYEAMARRARTDLQ